MKKTIADLHDVVVSFVANPIFKNLGVVDAKVIDSATKISTTLSISVTRSKKMQRLLATKRHKRHKTDFVTFVFFAAKKGRDCTEPAPSVIRPGI